MTICEVDGCSNQYDSEIYWTEPHEPMNQAKVCGPHLILNEILVSELGKFYNIIIVEQPRQLLIQKGVIDK